MEDVKKRYFWEVQNEIDAIAEKLRLLRETHAIVDAEFETNIRHQYRIPSSMPPAGSEFFYIGDRKVERAVVKNPNHAHAVTFTADESGPTMVKADGTVIRNVRSTFTVSREDSAPLYPAGAALCYYNAGPAPMLDPGTPFKISTTSFGGSNMLLLKKAPDITISKADYHKETATAYRILDKHGQPTFVKTNPGDFKLRTIAGRVIGVEPVCSAVDMGADPNDVFMVSLSEMLVPIEPQVKSAAKKQ